MTSAPIEHLHRHFADVTDPRQAGKTSTIQMLVGVLRPTSGNVNIAGFDVENQALEAKRKIGYLAQAPFLYGKLTGFEFLRFVGGLYGVAEQTIADKAKHILDLLDLTEKANQLIETYSGGMQHKIGLCSILLHDPQVLILDEPLAGLDPRSARQIKDLLRDFCDNGGTVFMSTHVLEIAERMCDRVGILKNGQLIAEGSLQALREQAKSETDGTLEDLFLQVTATDAVSPVAEALR